MAEKAADAKKKDEVPDEAKPAKKAAPIWTKLPVLLGGAMVIEAAVMVGAFKMLGGGAKAANAGTELTTAEPAKPAEGGHEEAAAHGDAAPAAGGHGEEGGHGGAAKPAEAAKKPGTIEELEVTTFRAPNTQSGRRFIYDVAIFACVKTENRAKVEGVLKSRKATIEDRIRTIIAESEPEKLGGGAGTEPGLETLRRQVKYKLEEIVGEGLVEEILVPKCIPFRGD